MKFVLYFRKGKAVFEEDEIAPGRSSYFLEENMKVDF